MTTLTNKHPKILTHKDVFSKGDYYGSGHYIITDDLKLFSNRCPHRGNKVITPGTVKEEFKCGLHGWEWSKDGAPCNNNVNLKPRQVTQGESGLIFLDWDEPVNSKWAQQLKNDKFTYSHNVKKHGQGDWRWQMEMHVDLLHVEQIHPLLNSYVDCTKLETEHGYDWVCQHHEHGWWLFVYPFTHIEYEEGCLYISEMVPRENDQGYDVYIHYLFNESVTEEKRKHFAEMAEVTFDEDIVAVNELSAASKYRMPSNAPHKLEEDIIHFYKWVEENVD